MPFHTRPICFALALALLAAGCTPMGTGPSPTGGALPAGAPAAAGAPLAPGAATPTPTGGATVPVPQAAPTPAKASFQGMVYLPTGMKPNPPTFISTNGSTFISTNGSTFISTNGSTFISTNGSTFISTNGSTYRTQNFEQAATGQVEVALATLDNGRLKTVEGRPSVRTDAAGGYLFDDVPADRTYVVAALVLTKEGKGTVLMSLGRPGPAPVPVSGASTIVTAAALKRGGIPTDLAAFNAAVAAVEAKVTNTQIPALGDGDAAAAYGEALARELPALATLLEAAAAARVPVVATPVPASPSPTPVPTASPRRNSRGGGGSPTVPAKPLITDAPLITAIAATITWDAVAGATGYNVYLDNVLAVSNASGTEALVTGMTPSTTHSVEVSALNAVGESVRSDPANVMTGGEGTQAWISTSDVQLATTPALAASGLLANILHTGLLNGSTAAAVATLPDRNTEWLVSNRGSSDRAAPVVHDDEVYVGSATGLDSLAVADGALNWFFPTPDDVDAAPARGADGTLYVSTAGGGFYAVNPDGTQKWAKPALVCSNFASPVVAASGDIYVLADTDLYCFDDTGAQQWVAALPTMQGSNLALAADGTIYFAGDNGVVYAIDPATGAIDWTFNAGTALFSSPATGTDGTIYVGVNNFGGDRGLLALNPDGTQKWVHDVGDPVYNPVAVGADGAIYFTANAQIYCVDDGGTAATPRWDATTGANGGPYCGIAIDETGRVYVAGPLTLIAFNSRSAGLASSSWPKVHKDAKNTGRL